MYNLYYIDLLEHIENVIEFRSALTHDDIEMKEYCNNLLNIYFDMLFDYSMRNNIKADDIPSYCKEVKKRLIKEKRSIDKIK